MTLKKIISLILALVLTIGIVVPGILTIRAVADTHEHTLEYDAASHWGSCSCGLQLEKTEHSFAPWVFDTQKGTQSRTCQDCGYVDTLLGTNSKVSQVEAPVVGQSYYLAANVGGTIYYFRHGTISDTTPYSLVVTNNVDHNWAFPLTLEAPVEGSTGFQLTYTNPTSGAKTRIYCYDVKTDGANKGVMDTGANTANYLNRHTFFVDTVNGQQVLRKIGNNNVLVVKYNETKKDWRMLGVPESELSKDGVYPAMLVNAHVHSFAYEQDQEQHWQSCYCGTVTSPESHNFQMDETLGYEVCVCGASKQPHDCVSADGKWYPANGKHHQICEICGSAIAEADHSYGDWQFDEENGTQSRSCTACQQIETLHGTDTKVWQAEAPVAGDSYHLAANVDGTIRFFVLEGSVSDTTPYSLHTTSNFENPNLRKVTLEVPVAGDTGFQITVLRPSDDKLLRIYCYDAGGSDGIMDTGTNAGNELEKHTFFADRLNGVQVLRKLGNNNILVAKFNEAKNEWRMLGVPESELSGGNVYPVMLVDVHAHSFSYSYSSLQHWNSCACGKTEAAENHSFQMDEALGYEVCHCGAVLTAHDCVSADGKWIGTENEHYQLCGICGKQIGTAQHSYGAWSFDTEKGTQNRSCSACGFAQVLYGTDSKVSAVDTPVVGETYYLAANAGGTIYYFRHGSVTDTFPYSLWVSSNFDHNWVFPLTVEAPVEGNTGFQLTYTHPTTSNTVRIYCYDAGGSDGVMDTGVNSTNVLNNHTFYIDEVDGVQVLRKVGNNNILVVKYNEELGDWRMLGVPESELANQEVYPVMLANAHSHSFEDPTYHSDEAGHWYACQCGGKSDYQAHSVSQWQVTVQPTDTVSGSKTGTCTVCGAKAVKQIPPTLPDGYYLITGTVNGTKYYLRNKTGTESIEHTVPFSLHTSADKADGLQVNTKWDEDKNTYLVSYFTTRQINLYIGDVNGSTIAKDSQVDLGTSATTDEKLIDFSWDPATKRLYQMEGKVKYVLGFKTMTNSQTQQPEVRLLAVPEEQLGTDAVAAQLEVVHQHSYAQAWSFDAVSHWHQCECGEQKDMAEHTIDQWKIEKEPTAYAAGKKTGVCSLCAQTIVNAIPMLNEHVKAPTNGARYYLTGSLNGVKYFFTHAPSGGSVTSTVPYSLYTKYAGKVNMLTVAEASGNYRLYYGNSDYHIYISGDGVGVTTNTKRTDLVEFQWDAENKLLYQLENGVKQVLVFKTMKNVKTGAQEIRITAMPMEQALIDPTVAIAQLSTQPPAVQEEKKDNPAELMPEDATALQTVTLDNPETDSVNPQNGYVLKWDAGQEKTDGKDSFDGLLLAGFIWLVVLAVAAVVLALLKNTKFGVWFFGKWNLWSAICMILAALVLILAVVMPSQKQQDAPALSQFAIVANGENTQAAHQLAVTIFQDYGISLPVVEAADYQGSHGIFLDVLGHNSYGGYKYSVFADRAGARSGVFINGSGPALDTAIAKWLKSVKNTDAFPFGLKEKISGYEWNTDDVNMTGLGFSLAEAESSQLYEGVELRKLRYESFGYGKVTGYAVIVDSDAQVELKVAAGEWDENTTTENPATKHTVQQYGQMLTDAGYEVLAITNAGFYDLNTTMTYIPWGLQVVDGLVKHEPSEDNPKNTHNWFAQTADGKYVISDTNGYFETYVTKLAQGVGGGIVLMRDGKPCFTSTGVDYRTVVGITKDGDLVILTMPGANYAVIAQIFMDLDVDIDTVLNLDGGGSTTLHSLDENQKLVRLLCETPVEREVADAIAIVKKK